MFTHVEDGINEAGRVAWGFFHNVPIQGALASGVLGLYAATAFGVSELALAGLSAYVTYRMFAFGEPLLEAVEKTIKFQKGELPVKEENPNAYESDTYLKTEEPHMFKDEMVYAF